MPYTFLALLAVIGLLALIPTRRLFLAGWSSGALVAYFLTLVGLGLIVAELRAPARFLIPILVIVYIAPFVTARAGLARIFDRAVGGRHSIVVRPIEPPSLPAGEALSSSGVEDTAPAQPDTAAAGAGPSGTEAAGTGTAGTGAAAGPIGAGEPIGAGDPEDGGRA
jgi:hypothetical protein